MNINLKSRLRAILRGVRRTLIPDSVWKRVTWFHFFTQINEKVPGPLTYNQDGLASKHNCDFIHDERFSHAYAAGKATGSWGRSEVHWRAHVVCWAAQKGMSLEGDFVECGVNKGGLASAVMHYTELYKTTRKFYLLDTFNGLVERYLTADEKRRDAGAVGYEECFEAVKRTFSGFPNAVIVKGAVPETLKEVTAKKIAFLSIDMNCVEPEIAAAEYFWERLSSGAVMVLDDYGWSGHILQKKAFDRFAFERGVQVLSLPTGQGIIIKP
ncbi:MAG: TylF/MycF/NovP-related O-methyltransferase [Gallionella sp.]|nr:TylF/MycF/NovP-related O-methyltransferase [Gallionella sp.]